MWIQPLSGTLGSLPLTALVTVAVVWAMGRFYTGDREPSAVATPADGIEGRSSCHTL
jgi:hypothetical protein